jgi:predicted metal-dependent hydrolase
MRLWMWHLAEEFEHRSVVHDVLNRLYGPEEAYELRKAGATFNRRHNSEHTYAAAAYITEIDQAEMTQEQRDASNARASEARAALSALLEAQMLWVFEPDYDPAAVAPPRDYERVLGDFPRADG